MDWFTCDPLEIGPTLIRVKYNAKARKKLLFERFGLIAVSSNIIFVIQLHSQSYEKLCLQKY